MEDPPNRDSSERILALEALRASEERYRLLFDRSPLPMWVYDQETLGFLAVNQAAIDHYGYTRDQFGAMTIAQVRPEGEALEPEEELAAGAEEKAPPSIVRHRKASGDTIDVEIDASFVQTMATDEKNRRIVETILALGKNLGVEVIAEGVETAQQAQVLTRLGCDYVQGFLFSEAVDLDAAARLVESEAPFTPAPLKLPA